MATGAGSLSLHPEISYSLLIIRLSMLIDREILSLTVKYWKLLLNAYIDLAKKIMHDTNYNCAVY